MRPLPRRTRELENYAPMSDAAASGPWYADGLKFSCTQCGNCCGGAPGYVWITDTELTDLAALVGLPVDAFRKDYVRRVRGWLSLKERPNGDCVFLRSDPDGKKRCGVYAARPLQCRTWPFWESNVSSPAAWQQAGRGCPGIDTGEHHPLPVIQSALRRNEAAGLNL